jgi:hypothetical protein
MRMTSDKMLRVKLESEPEPAGEVWGKTWAEERRGALGVALLPSLDIASNRKPRGETGRSGRVKPLLEVREAVNLNPAGQHQQGRHWRWKPFNQRQLGGAEPQGGGGGRSRGRGAASAGAALSYPPQRQRAAATMATATAATA